ncbi:Imm52 family immunity protein [Orbus wheelerorum]|uniref:hypothetical protein n=1 Tax=Orbus wheelerorum TaxID=3074111 RepID=UPI00370DC4D8
MQEILNVQFRIHIYLPKVTLITYADFCQRLENALKVYQQCFDPKMAWYFFKNTVKVKPEELVYNSDGLTEFGLKKLSLAHKKIDKDGDTQISFIDGEHKSSGQVITYDADKSFKDSFVQSKIKFFFTKPNDSQILKQITSFVTELAKVFTDSYIEIDLMQTFSKVNALFVKRIGVSLIAYIPSPLQASDYPEAHQVIPIYKDDKQVGTVIVSLDHFPSIENTEDVKTMNRIDLRLHEADLLPIRSDL